VTDTAITSRDAAAVAREQWRSFLRNMPRGALANSAVAAAFAGAVAAGGMVVQAGVWLAVALAVNAARALAPRLWGKRALGRQSPGPARRRILASTVASGVVWGAGFIVILPGTDTTLHAVAVALAAGICAGAITTSGAIYGAFLGFVLPVLAPVTAVLLYHGTATTLALAGLVVAGMLILVPAAHDMNRKLVALMRTDRLNRRLIRELGRERDRAAESDRAKSEFLATMSHEIRTPMNGVLGMAELLAKTPLTPAQRHYVGSLHRSGQVLLNLINDVLDVSKIESGKFELGDEAFDLRRMMGELEQMFAPRASEKGIALNFTTHSSAACAYAGDPTRVQQILMNLVGNAIKFTDSGGVEVCAWRRQAADTGSCVRIEVRDTGPGIPQGKQAGIFGAFDQADSSRTRHHGGTGLGLHIAQKLVHLMNGEIGVASTPGQGSRFWVELPLAPARETPRAAPRLPRAQSHRAGNGLVFEHPVGGNGLPDSAEVAGPRTPRGGEGQCVLLAEDNVVNQQVARTMLEHMGCEVVTVASGDDALAAVTEESQRFDLALMDCDMPVMDGFEVTRRIRAWGLDHVRLPIIALTASAMRGDKDRCLAAGMTGYIAKPVSETELAAALAGKYHAFGGDPAATAAAEGDGATPTASALPAPAETDSDAGPADTPDGSENAPGTESNGPAADSERALTDILDPATVEKLHGLQKPGGPDVFAQLADQFTHASSKQITELEAAIHNMDSITVKRTAHSLKSSSASVGALKLSEQFRSIEHAGAAADLTRAAAELPPAQAELEQVHRALRTLRDDPAARPSAS